MLPRMDSETRRWLHRRLADQYAHLLPFVTAVAAQLARRDEQESLRASAERVVALLPGEAGASRGARVEALLADPPLLASFFQNVDLLYEHSYGGADEVSAWIMQALERAAPQP